MRSPILQSFEGQERLKICTLEPLALARERICQNRGNCDHSVGGLYHEVVETIDAGREAYQSK